jgi:hypothetical protein
MSKLPSLPQFNGLIVIPILFLLTEPLAGITYLNASTDSLTPVATIAKAFTDQQNNIQVKQKGIITRILSDDTIGDRHQRMIVRLSNNQTLLITHNIDLAPRVPNPVVGKTITFYGEYEWNDEGGVVHWTHKDPDGKHITGWLECEGKQYSTKDNTVPRLFEKTTHQSKERYSSTMSDTRNFNLLGRMIKNDVNMLVSGICINKIQLNFIFKMMRMEPNDGME